MPDNKPTPDPDAPMPEWAGGGVAAGVCAHCQIDHGTPCHNNACLCRCPLPPL